ncbi:cation:proton antiporter [Bariatricus sp. HCP28S3_C2]|uniref:cation:proton antiporter n=1 Tax=unclassified Bariatricus TaxID=2677046 RepID=UPI002A99080A|nr:cation:proton antiporter [bacterium]MDY5456275.1 cation:proton antiporter [Bariatricus sp.]
MLTSLAFIFLVGLSLAAICQRIRLPRIIGMLVTGILLGPYVLDLLDGSILGISPDLRKMALVIILIKAGLSLNIKDLKKVGRPALMLAFVPASFEMLAYTVFAPFLFDITRIEAAVMGAVLSAVSPAVVVPRMVMLMEEKYGTDKSIPQMILAGASLDDVFVIVLFSTFTAMAQGGSADVMSFVNIPVSILLGILLGAVAGMILAWFFETSYSHEHLVRNSMKVIIVLGTAFLLLAIEEWVEPVVSVSGLLAIMSMACVLAMRCVPEVSGRLSEKYGKLWIAAEVILFVLVGAAVDIRYTLQAGFAAVVMIAIALVVRSVGVCICTAGTRLNRQERIFCVLAYLPKATVQAAIGSVPLALGLPCGNLVLSVAVLAILITAPLGALGMDASYRKLLVKAEEE